MVTPNQPGFKYLYFFKEEFQADMSEILREGPTVRRVVEIITQNIDFYPNILAEYKIKSIRFDQIQSFDLEIPDENDWEPIYLKLNEKDPCLLFKNKIVNSLYDEYDINENFIKKYIRDDKDKDIMVSKEDVEKLISCKFRDKRNIGFNDIERTAVTSYYYGVQGVVVTNLDYSPKAKKYASKYNIILSHSSNLKRRLNHFIQKELDEKEFNILYDFLKE
ncbi:8364_t:CDS:2 [Scutellospora calospora]|uniref:8364_t:CDS:1 n=1 Tax=Scutellospora calospora TaxID=85575 RepID=A0ACA9JZH3_9GLOM|nr:8364_t:CDS:2 [Scutellospora calospora]